ncbi:hypothetical protein Tco_1148463 [Tanacetum coccineum]
MTKINDVEANLQQFKSVTLALQKETSNRFDRMQESIDKNKADADRQFAELLTSLLMVMLHPLLLLTPAVAPLEQSFVPLERIKQNQAEHHKMFIWYIILKLGYEICLGHLLTNVRLKQEPEPAQRRTWDPGITHGDILKQHLEDKVFLGAGVLI